MVLLQQSRLCVIVLLILSLVHVASQALLSSSLDCTTACLGLSSCETPTTCAVVQSQIGCECHECSRPCEGSRRLLAAGNATLGCECIDTSCEVECAEFATSDIWESHDLKCLCEQCKCVAKEPTVEACERIARSVSSDAGIRHIGCATASNLVSRACGDMRVLTTLPKSVDCSDVKLAGVFSVEEEVVVSSYGRLTGGDLDAGGFETRIFRIASGARLDLNEVMLRNGITARLAGGGCVLIEKFGELFAKNVTFADCVASKTHGGAVAAWSFTYVELHGCAILRAAARILGGGIALAQNAALRIVASQVSDCLSLGGAGGGFSLLGSSRVTIVGTEVSRCHAESTGGALQLQGAYLNMSESRIENCSSTYAGGLRIDDATVFVASSRISGCVAHVAGAGLLVSAHILSLVTLRDTIIDRCSSYSGGAAIARQLGSTLVLAGRTVVEKCADVYNAPLVSFDSSLIVGFEASIRNCTSSNAGAVEMNGGQLEFGGVIASNFGHETGGILGTDAAALSIGPYARLLRNMCKKHGGAVQVRDNATLEVSGPGVRVVRNMALLGGAFYLDAADVAFVTGPDVIVAENWASMDGGAFFTAASRLVLQGGVLLRENHCSDNGGALALVDSQLFVSSRGHVWVEWAMDFTQASGDIEGSVAVIYDTVMRLPYDADYTTMSQHAELGSRVVQYSCLNCESSYFFDGYSYTSIGWNGGFAMAKILNRERSERRVEVAESQHASNVAFSCASIDGVVKLVGNGAGGSGGAVWFSGASRGFIRGAEVTSNSCLESGSGFFVGILDSLRATNTTFHGNVGEGSVFVSTLAKVELETIVAHANVGGFLVVDTARAVNLKTVDVFDNRALTGAGLRIIKTANVSVRASAFWRNAADGDGGAITLIDSDVVFSNTNFDMNSAGASGGAIASFGKSTLHFQQEDCNLVDFVTDFTRTAASCSSVFFETAAQSTLTCDFYPLPCSELTYFGSCDGCGCYGGHINDASGIERGVVLEPPTLASVYAITPRASAVHVKSVCLSEGQYSARAIDKLNAAWGYGGTFTVVVKPNRGPLAIYHAGPIASNGSIAPVGFQLRADDASCKAYSNSAGKGGGFAFWDVQEPSWDGLVDKGGNMAAYGAVRATPAMALRLMSTPAIITSGARIVDPTLRVAVSDAYNQVVASATSTASVRTNATVANVFVANGFASFANGSASFPSLIIIGPPGRSIDLNVESPLATLAQGADVVHIQVEVRACFPYEKEMSDTCVSCPAGSYLFRDKPTDEGYCVDCPVGALCASSGSALSTLRTKSGWWRATATATKLYKCLPANACPASSPTAPSILYGSPGSCRKGHSGARCGACVRGYFNLHRGPCRRCQGGDRVFAIVFYCAFSGVMIALLTYLLIFDSGVRFGMRLHDARMAIAGHNGLVSLAVHRQGRDQTDDDSDIRAPVVSFLIKARALWAFFQIISGLPQVLDNVEFPSLYLGLVDVAHASSLSFFNLVPTRCMLLTTNRDLYVNGIISTTVWPLLLSIFIWVVCYCKVALAAIEARRQLRTYYTQAVLLLSHVTLSPTALAASQVFVCSSYDYGRGTKKRFLRVAPAVQCDTETWRWLVLYGALVNAICISVPIMYAVLLFSSRRFLNPRHAVKYKNHPLQHQSLRHLAASQSFARTIERSSAHQRQLILARERVIDSNGTQDVRAFHFLWANIKPMYYYFEVIESVRRLTLTSIFAVLRPGSALQITLGYVVSMVFALLTLMTSPYVHRDDNLVHIAAQLSASTTLFITLSLRGGNIGMETANILLITVALIPVAFALFTLRSVVPRPRILNQIKKTCMLESKKCFQKPIQSKKVAVFDLKKYCRSWFTNRRLDAPTHRGATTKPMRLVQAAVKPDDSKDELRSD